ncbi:ester cyclase [Candidatus Dormiibacter inghamiae]|uniref:ester cyclase n=1 Tax=Candidatus Dormiibacter inghamiae TaxID=3127013 RepID=UPI001A195F73|nr:ester cyclase [Candidatus Dormibacteraeota bacterium]
MGLEENKALVRRYYKEVLTGRDRELLAQLLDPSFVSHVPGGPVVGIDVYAAAVEATHAAFADLVVTVEDQVAERDRVTTRWSASGTHTGSFAGVAATGRPVTVTGMHFHRIGQGRLVEHWEELDQLGAMRQMGALG